MTVYRKGVIILYDVTRTMRTAITVYITSGSPWIITPIFLFYTRFIYIITLLKYYFIYVEYKNSFYFVINLGFCLAFACSIYKRYKCLSHLNLFNYIKIQLTLIRNGRNRALSSIAIIISFAAFFHAPLIFKLQNLTGFCFQELKNYVDPII